MGRSRAIARVLVAVNVSLLAVLLALVWVPLAQAQREAPARARGLYTMVGGAIRGGNANAVWIIDALNRELIAIRWNESRRQLEGLGYRNLAEDAALRPGR